jgi:hypothetical protein
MEVEGLFFKCELEDVFLCAYFATNDVQNSLSELTDGVYKQLLLSIPFLPLPNIITFITCSTQVATSIKKDDAV